MTLSAKPSSAMRPKPICEICAASENGKPSSVPCTVDEYFRDKFVFSAFGYVLYIQSELVANSFASLPECEQQILILHYALELPDREVGDFVGMSRSAVQRHRTKTLNELQKDLKSKGVRN